MVYNYYVAHTSLYSVLKTDSSSHRLVCASIMLASFYYCTMSLTTFMSASLDFCTMPDTQSSFLWICFTSFMFVSFGSCTVSSTIPFLLGYWLVHPSWPHIFTFAPCLTLYSSFLCMVGTSLAFACFTTRCLMVIFSSFSTADSLLCLVEIFEVR